MCINHLNVQLCVCEGNTCCDCFAKFVLQFCAIYVSRHSSRICTYIPMSDLLFCFLFRGGLQLAIDAELLLQKGALVTIRVCHAKGMVEVKFTKEPFSHWSLSLLPVSDGMDVFCNVIHAAMFGPWPILQNDILVSYEHNVDLPIFWTYTTVRIYCF